jgi:[NiFe] hydrogenase diaphorase moiety large subunit
MVDNNIRHAGASSGPGARECRPERSAAQTGPSRSCRHDRGSGIRGCGGAGFPTGKKWRFAAQTEAERRFVICNADEGEPGTFKDRVLLTERPHLMIEGMTIAARAIGAREGIHLSAGRIRLSARPPGERLADRRAAGCSGAAIWGDGFDFDIRIQMGAGAYICGEEGALISPPARGCRANPRRARPIRPTRLSGLSDRS